MRSLLRKLKYGISNLIYWFPVIWEDRDWDYAFLLRIMSHKLKRMEKKFAKHSNHLYAERDVRSMKVARLLLERIDRHDYIFLNLKWDDTQKSYYQEFNRKKNFASWGQPDRDIEYLCTILRKYMTKWWW